MNRKSPYGDIGREDYWQIVRWRFLHHRLACISLVVLAVICTVAIPVPVIAPYDPDTIAEPFSAPPSPGFLLRMDQIGRDMFSRLLYVTRISLLVGALATAISTAIGVSLGLLGEYFGGWLDIAIMRFTNMAVSSPYILLMPVAVVIFGPGFWSIILILGFVDWPGIARLVRGNMSSLWETNLAKSSIVVGMSARHILFSEILPNIVVSVLVYTTLVMALSMLDEAPLSFLGMGAQSPTANLDNMLNSAQSSTTLTKRSRLQIPPGLLIVVPVAAINFVGDALRDTLDPSAVLNLDGAKQDTPEQDTAKQNTPDNL